MAANAVAILTIVMLCVLVGCGRRGDLTPPPHADPAYPRTYPAP